MRKNLVIVLAVFGLAGCAASMPQPSQQYGNFVPTAPFNQQQLGTDAAQKLASLYAAAQTRLELQQPATDPFGQALVQSLRAKGFAVQEFTPSTMQATGLAEANNKAEASSTPATPGGWPLHYVLDQAEGGDLYRVILQVGKQTITRAYLVQNGVLTPAGYWARKE